MPFSWIWHRSVNRRFGGIYRPQLQCLCTLGSLVPKLLGQCPLGSPSLFPPDRLLYRLWPATCSPISNDASPPLSALLISHVAIFSPSLSLYSCCFRLVIQSADTCSRWSLASGYFYPEDGGDAFPETSVHTRTTRRHIPENIIVHSHRRENLKSYIRLHLSMTIFCNNVLFIQAVRQIHVRCIFIENRLQ
jgi:hypothetical protein